MWPQTHVLICWFHTGCQPDGLDWCGGSNTGTSAADAIHFRAHFISFFLFIMNQQITQDMYNILEPRGYKMKCRGKINVKGKGSMITYFLQKPTAVDCSDAVLTHQNSKMTAASSEDYELCDDDAVDDMNSDSARLTQKRKSLCRQHNIFSSLTNKSIASNVSEHIMGGSFDANDDILVPNEKTKLLSQSNSQASTVTTIGGAGSIILSPETYPKKCDFKPNLPQHCVTLKDSIESLEKFLKNDYSLSDLSTTKVMSNKVGTENGDAIVPFTMNPLNPKVFVTAQPNHSNNNKTKANGMPSTAAMTTATVAAHIAATPPNTNSMKMMDDPIKRTIKRTINFGDRNFMKISKSLYPMTKERIDTFKIPNSKSMCVISSQNQNGSVSLI